MKKFTLFASVLGATALVGGSAAGAQASDFYNVTNQATATGTTVTVTVACNPGDVVLQPTVADSNSSASFGDPVETENQYGQAIAETFTANGAAGDVLSAAAICFALTPAGTAPTGPGGAY